ncbi:MAG: hypothetical protein ACW99U_19205 [Candidatus Thorarchaeota archaeon]|jgi:hypothetical protein
MRINKSKALEVVSVKPKQQADILEEITGVDELVQASSKIQSEPEKEEDVEAPVGVRQS